MADTVATIVADFRAETASFQRAMDGVKTKVGGIEKSMNAMGTAVKRAIGGYLTFEAARRAITHLATETMAAEQSVARLEAVLQATGNTTGRTARELEKMADSLQRTTLFKDEEIREATAVLATFRSVSGDAFTRTIELAGDLASIFGGELQSSVQALGKVLEDPSDGMGMLARKIGDLTDAEKKHIKELMEQNRLHEAQAVILDKVAGKVKGAADAMGKSGLTGNVNALSDAWGEFVEESGRALFGENMSRLREFAGFIDKIRESDIIAKDPNSEAALEIRLRRTMERIKEIQKSGKLDDPIDVGTLEGQALITLRSEYTLLHETRQKLRDQMAPFLKAEEAAKKVAEDSAAATAKQVAAERTRLVVLAGAEEAEKKAMKGLAGLADEAARIMENRWVQFKAGLQAAEEAEKDATEEILAAQKKVFAEMERNAEALDRADEEFAKAEAAKRWVASWGHAFEEIQDRFASGFERLLTGQIKNFRDFAQMILNIWAQTLAQMAAAQASAGLMSLGASLLGSFLGRGGGPLSGMVDSPSLPGMGGGGMQLASMAGSAGSGGGAAVVVSNHFTIQSLDPRTTAQIIEQQAPTIVGTVVQALDRSSALRQKFAGR